MTGNCRLLAALITKRPIITSAIEIFESVAWIALGFVPTLAAMETAWRIGRRRLIAVEVGIRR